MPEFVFQFLILDLQVEQSAMLCCLKQFEAFCSLINLFLINFKQRETMRITVAKFFMQAAASELIH